MKKFYFLAMLSLAAAASCSKTELVTTDNDLKPISMDVFQHKATKATEINGDNVTGEDFAIQCYQMNALSSATSASAFYSDQTLDYASSKWDTDPTYYWPYVCVSEGTHSATNSLSFYAYNAGTYAKGTYPSAQPTLTYTVADAAASQKDVIAANAEYRIWQTDAATSMVPLTFKHILSEICFTVKGEDNKFYYEVLGVEIGKNTATTPVAALYSGGTYTYGANGAQGTTVANTSSTQKSYIYGEHNVTASAIQTIAVNNTNDIALSTESLMLIPQAATGVTISVTFAVYTDATKATQIYAGTKTTGTLAETWATGKKYTYALKLSGGHPIEYTVGVSDWETATTADVTLQ